MPVRQPAGEALKLVFACVTPAILLVLGCSPESDAARKSADTLGVLNEELRIDGNEHVLLPPNSRLGAATLDHVWLIEKGEFDVESIVRYAVTWTSSAPSRQHARTQ